MNFYNMKLMYNENNRVFIPWRSIVLCEWPEKLVRHIYIKNGGTPEADRFTHFIGYGMILQLPTYENTQLPFII